MVSTIDTLTACARAERRIERKKLRTDLGDRGVPVEAQVALREPVTFAVLPPQLDDTIAQLVRQLDRFREPGLDPITNGQTVDHQVDGGTRWQSPDVLQIRRGVIHAQANEALCTKLGDERFGNRITGTGERRKHGKAVALRKAQGFADHLRHRVCL